MPADQHTSPSPANPPSVLEVNVSDYVLLICDGCQQHHAVERAVLDDVITVYCKGRGCGRALSTSRRRVAVIRLA